MSTDHSTQEELWRPVVGFEDFYDVSNLGNVRSKHTRGRPTNGNVSLTPNKKGYLRVQLNSPTHRRSSVVHRLVLFAFIGPPPSSCHECNHKNGVKHDNRLENLEWVTRKENNAHAVRNGYWHPHKGEAHGRAVLTERDVRAIRQMEGKTTQSFLARWFGVRKQTIASIWKRRLWKHVE